MKKDFMTNITQAEAAKRIEEGVKKAEIRKSIEL